MDKQFDIAVYGATSLVGEALLDLIGDHELPIGRVYPLEDVADESDVVVCRNRSLSVQEVTEFDFRKVRIFVSCVRNPELAIRAYDQGCAVIHVGAVGEQTPDWQVAGINTHALEGDRILCVPDGAVVALARVVQVIAQDAGCHRLDFTLLRAVAAQGRSAVEALAGQTARLLNAQGFENTVFPKQLAFNVLTRESDPCRDGFTPGEGLMAGQLAGILDLAADKVVGTVLTVPVFFGDTLSVRLELGKAANVPHLASLLAQAEGIEYLDEPGADGFPTPVTDAANSNQVWVSRLRQDPASPAILHLVVVVDSVRKGVAFNILQIAASLLKGYLS